MVVFHRFDLLLGVRDADFVNFAGSGMSRKITLHPRRNYIIEMQSYN